MMAMLRMVWLTGVTIPLLLCFGLRAGESNRRLASCLTLMFAARAVYAGVAVGLADEVFAAGIAGTADSH
jgi:hypothetical protein